MAAALRGFTLRRYWLQLAGIPLQLMLLLLPDPMADPLADAAWRSISWWAREMWHMTASTHRTEDAPTLREVHKVWELTRLIGIADLTVHSHPGAV